MTQQGYDALGHPAPAAVGRGHFIGQYLKNLTRAQVDAYHAAGVDVVLIWETTGRRALGGYPAGVADGKAALAAMNALGAPMTVACYFAEDDFNVTAAQAPTVVAYARGAAAVLTKARTGFYGGLLAVQAVQKAGIVAYDFQTYAWSGGKWAPGVELEQYLNGQQLGGTAVDFDRALGPIGAWLAPKPVTPVPTPVNATRRFAMLVFALGDDYVFATGFRHGVLTRDVAEAKAAIARGEVVKVLGGPAATALGLSAGQHGATQVIVGATFHDTAVAAAGLMA